MPEHTPEQLPEHNARPETAPVLGPAATPRQATVFAPLIHRTGDTVSVEFSPDHPGYGQPEYARHRAGIAAAALAFEPGGPVPRVDYLDAEHSLWADTVSELATLHRQYACARYLEGSERLALPLDHVPQLADIAAALRAFTGFTMEPAAGLVPVRDFYGALADRRFQATQYIRHPAFPRFSPEPDMLHEVVGHGNALADPVIARLYEAFGRAVRRLGDAAVSVLSSIFWFTAEYGLVRENGEPRVLGASLLTSCGELAQFRRVPLRPIDLAEMSVQPYGVEDFQPVLFVADSFAHLEDVLLGFLGEVQDDDELIVNRTRRLASVG